jgi:hypothetical protein
MEHKNTLAIISLLGILLMVSNASALGVSPGTIEFNKMVRGGYGEKTLTVSTAGSEDIVMKLEAAGAIKDWLSFDPMESQIVLPKQSGKAITVKINVPNTARNGEYEGTVVISTLYQGAAGSSDVSGAHFMPGVIVQVKLTIIGEEIMGYDLKSVSVKDTEQNYPVEFNINVENTGNVVVTPKLHIAILDGERKDTGKSLDYAETQVLPTTTKQFSIKMPTKGMDVGAYYGKITDDLGHEQTLFFQVLAPGTLAIVGDLTQLSLNKIWVQPQETVKIDAQFQNTGQVFIDSAKLKTEVYQVDPTYNTKALVTVTEGEPLSVAVGATVDLSAYFTPQKAGRYSIEGTVIYSGKSTEVKSSVLNVLEEAKNYTLYYLLIGAVVLLLVFYLTRMTEDGRTRRFKKLWGDYLNIK